MNKVLTIPVNLYRKYPVFFFVFTVAILILLFYLTYRNPWFESHVFTPLVNIYAWLSGQVLLLFGYDVVIYSDIISSSGFSVSVKKGCDAAEPMAIFVAGILAFPALISRKLVGLGVGLAVLFVLNIIRIVTLYLTGVYNPDFFESMHLAVWQVAFIAVAVLLWFLWLRSLMRQQTAK
jgi:exosortase H (IPTLxxWG-CTERM-specific)